ncbi:MAG: cyclase family protein [bacterium]
MKAATRIVDLSHVLYPGEEQYKLEIAPQKERSGPESILYEVSLWSHVGTHVEYALHFLPEGREISTLPLWRMVGQAVRVDLRDKNTNEPIDVDDFQQRAEIRKGDIVLTWTGRDVLYRTPKSHDRPYVTSRAAQWLADDREISALGTDSSGFEVRDTEKLDPNHFTFLDREDPIPIIECMANLGELIHPRFFMVALPLRIVGLDAWPIRVLGIQAERKERNAALMETLSEILSLDERQIQGADAHA